MDIKKSLVIIKTNLIIIWSFLKNQIQVLTGMKSVLDLFKKEKSQEQIQNQKGKCRLGRGLVI